jgi:hypothetical protein
MRPNSHIGKDNYNILGNQRVGETHAARMRRVNGLQPMQTQLAPVRTPTVWNQPMGGVKEIVKGVPDSIAYGLVGGLAGGFVGEMIGSEAGQSVSNKESRKWGTGMGVATGSILSVLATKDTTSSEPVFESTATRLIVGGGILVAGLIASGLGGLDWGAMKKGAPYNKSALNIMIPAAFLALPMMAGKDAATSTSLGLGAVAAVAGAFIMHQVYEAVND